MFENSTLVELYNAITTKQNGELEMELISQILKYSKEDVPFWIEYVY